MKKGAKRIRLLGKYARIGVDTYHLTVRHKPQNQCDRGCETMRKRLFGALFLVAIFVMSNDVRAGLITYTETQSQTSNGQNFTFIEASAAAAASGATAEFIVEARGDFTTPNSGNESMDWNIDGIASASGWMSPNADEIQVYSYNDVYWRRTTTIGAATQACLSSDASFAVF